MKLENVINLVLISVIAYTIGKVSQRKHDKQEIERLIHELRTPKTAHYTYSSKKKKIMSNDEQVAFLFTSKKEAEDILAESVALISRYGRISVADVYDMVGVESCFSDNQYGWYSPSGIIIQSCPSSKTYILEFPKAQKLD